MPDTKTTPPPVLTLTTKPVRPVINVDGTDHRLSFYADFSPFQAKRFARLMEESVALLDTDEDAIAALPDDEQERLYEQAYVTYGGLIRVVLPTLPPETLAGLDWEQRQAVLHTFLEHASPAGAEPDGPAATTAAAPTPPPRAPARPKKGKKRGAATA